MANIVIYTSEICGYCLRAKQLLDQKGVTYTEIRVDLDPQQRTKMINRSGGRRTVPQIFINDQHIGGCDDLMALANAGKLEPLLAT